MDMRVRIQDSAGNWSAWFTTRLEFPASVEVSPQGTNVVAPGATQQFTAVARDKNGLVSPGDPIMWTSYTGAALGSVDDDGLYTAATTAVGLDLVYGCAGLAFNFAGVLVSNVGGGDYWAPCWSIGSGLGVAAGTFLHYRMTVYAGKEYAFDTDTDGGGGTTGNADLYLRFGNPPTTSIWEVRRATTSVKENVTWTAPSDGCGLDQHLSGASRWRCRRNHVHGNHDGLELRLSRRPAIPSGEPGSRARSTIVCRSHSPRAIGRGKAAPTNLAREPSRGAGSRCERADRSDMGRRFDSGAGSRPGAAGVGSPDPPARKPAEVILAPVARRARTRIPPWRQAIPGPSQEERPS